MNPCDKEMSYCSGLVIVSTSKHEHEDLRPRLTSLAGLPELPLVPSVCVVVEGVALVLQQVDKPSRPADEANEEGHQLQYCVDIIVLCYDVHDAFKPASVGWRWSF